MSTTTNTEKKNCLSAIKPSGNLTLGNFIGAAKNFLKLQEDYNCSYFVADLHALTVAIEPKDLREYSLDMFAFFLAIGIDPEKSTLFVQSHVPEHGELAWILNCFTQFGEARRMTQFKDKSLKNPDNINLGLFNYPVLQAADILLYNAAAVPIGIDQKQHIELARNIAERFNNRYSPTFIMPEAIYPKLGAKVYSLSNPLVKMGKSEDDPQGVVLLKDDPDTIRRKFKRAVTDSETVVKYDPKLKPGVSNLLTIYATLLDLPIKKAQNEFASKSYVELKEKVAEVVIETLRPIQASFSKVRADKAFVTSLMQKGADKARYQARRVLSKVYRKVGLV